MPHYKDGTKAKIGDVAKAPHGTAGTFGIGPVLHIHEGADTCNLVIGEGIQITESEGTRIVTKFPGGSYVSAKDCEKLA